MRHWRKRTAVYTRTHTPSEALTYSKPIYLHLFVVRVYDVLSCRLPRGNYAVCLLFLFVKLFGVYLFNICAKIFTLQTAHASLNSIILHWCWLDFQLNALFLFFFFFFLCSVMQVRSKNIYSPQRMLQPVIGVFMDHIDFVWQTQFSQ